MFSLTLRLGAHQHAAICLWQALVDVVKHVKPHALFGLAGAGPAFGQDVVEALCECHPKPLIFPLSNPVNPPPPPPLPRRIKRSSCRSNLGIWLLKRDSWF